MKELELEIKQAIEKSLPKQVGDLLTRRLFDADLLEKAHEELNKTAGILRERIAKLESDIFKYKEYDERNSKLDARELNVKKREEAISTLEANTRIKALEEKYQDLKDITLGLVRNTTVRESLFGNKTVQDRNGYTVNLPMDENKQTDIV